MDDRSRQTVRWAKVLGWVLSLVALAVVARLLWQTDPIVWEKLRHVQLGLALLSLGIFQLWFLLRFWCWEIVTKQYGINDQLSSHIRMWTLSELMRYVPGNIWSFATRYRGAIQRGGRRSTATVALMVEALNLVAGASIVTAIFLRPEMWPLWSLGGVVYVFTLPWVIQRIARRRNWEFSEVLNYRKFLQLLVISLLLWTVYGLAQATIIKAIPNISTPNILFLTGANVAAWLIGYLSIITPMGLGVREVAMVAIVASSVAEGVSSILAVLTRVWLIISELVFLGLVLLFSRNK